MAAEEETEKRNGSDRPTNPRSRGYSKYAGLLRDDSVRRWYMNVSRGSRITADVYLRRLGSICCSHSVTPSTLIAKSKGAENRWAYFFLPCCFRGSVILIDFIEVPLYLLVHELQSILKFLCTEVPLLGVPSQSRSFKVFKWEKRT